MRKAWSGRRSALVGILAPISELSLQFPEIAAFHSEAAVTLGRTKTLVLGPGGGWGKRSCQVDILLVLGRALSPRVDSQKN